MIDIDDYINSLIKDNEHLKRCVASLQAEIRLQRTEISALREERRIFLDADKPPECVYKES